MSTEIPAKRESYTGWIIAVVLLLLLAVGIPLAVKFCGPQEYLVEVQGDPGGTVLWHAKSDLETQTGITNLPLRLFIHANNLEFTVHRTNYNGPLKLEVRVDGISTDSASNPGPNGSIRYYRKRNRSNSISESGTSVEP